MLTIYLAACSTVNGFTEKEAAIVEAAGEDGIMRLYTTGSGEELALLRRIADPVKASLLDLPEYGRLLEGMLATVNDTSNAGVGIAAPQVGISKRIIAVQRFDIEGNPFRFYLNPRITNVSQEIVESQEGCLSIPGERGTVPRHAAIVIEYNDPEDFTLRTETVEGFTAIIFQHETDHLDGVLFTDKTIGADSP